MIEDKTPTRASAIPRLVFVRVNGETIFNPIQEHFKDDFLIEVIPEVDLLRPSSRYWGNTVSLFYPYQKSSSRLDIGRLEMLARQHSTTPIFVGVRDDANIKDNPELQQYKNLKYISSNDLKDKKTLEELVRSITEVQINTMPNGFVVIYDPTELLKQLTPRLKEKKVWTAISDNEEKFQMDIAYNRLIMDAVVMDYPGPMRGKKLIEQIRELNPRVPIIALVPQSSINNLEDRCDADYTIIKTENKKVISPQVLYYLGRVLEKKSENEEMHYSVPKTEPTNKNNSMVFYIMGPSASGKTTVTELVANMLGNRIDFIKNHTTRPPRPDERSGYDHYFVSEKEFDDYKKQEHYIHVFEYRGFRYGIPAINVRQAEKAKRHIISVNPALEQLEPIKCMYAGNGFVPILMYANQTTLRERLERRGFGSQKEMDERVSRIDSDINNFDKCSNEFMYRLFTDNGLTPIDNAKRIVSIINWEEKQKPPSQRNFETTHAAYVESIVQHMFAVSTNALMEEKPNEIEFRFNPDAVKEYCSQMGYDGLLAFVKNQTPLRVASTTMAYGHLGIFFNSHPAKGMEYDAGMRNLFLDLIEKQIMRSGYMPKVRSRFRPAHISRFTLTISQSPTLIDGLHYALTDDYTLRPNANTPHSLSIGFVPFNKSMPPRPLTLPEIKDHILLNRIGHRWNWPYDNEIKCAYLRTPHTDLC